MSIGKVYFCDSLSSSRTASPDYTSSGCDLRRRSPSAQGANASMFPMGVWVQAPTWLLSTSDGLARAPANRSGWSPTTHLLPERPSMEGSGSGSHKSSAWSPHEPRLWLHFEWANGRRLLQLCGPPNSYASISTKTNFELRDESRRYALDCVSIKPLRA